MSEDAQWLLGQMSIAQPLAEHGANQHRQEVRSEPPAARGETQAYLLRRIARDQPDLLNEIGQGKRFKSARAAAIEAGIITPFPSLQLKEPVPTARKLLDKKGTEWCLQLLEELSDLVLSS